MPNNPNEPIEPNELDQARGNAAHSSPGPVLCCCHRRRSAGLMKIEATWFEENNRLWTSLLVTPDSCS
ncbi:hypothetical protein MATL_G00069790 [Megalops atlanticus]|uniref:Uncharacterized protein n=1 Tax=Megalops atlanticus TaxID=7932 RepID=A0A9D3TBU3_MEGAT|nr:hypothetical protein MATL_G00069790 [Megalops atlanticus]